MEAEDDIGIPKPSPTKEISKEIKPIGKDTVHRICSGQVVLSLAIAVKELVENSVDAGATLVEVKLKDQGLDSIEVSDNGPGVEEKNFAGLTAKYHTSKIREFSDLSGVETFGFRGEALSSLCALSDMVITTKHSILNIGTRLELDHHGNIKKQTHCARSIGTTVILSKLFNTLPVRKREFTKNIKKEFTKMCQILQAYGLVSKGVRIICTNQNSKGIKTTFMSTHGSQNILDNISAIFGSKQIQDLIELKSPIEENKTFNKELFTDLIEDGNINLEINQDDIDKLNLSHFKIDGWISSCNHGSGRSSKDRQYFFINSRPCDPKNISKIINEVYHRYNVQQYPFIYLNILMQRSDVDVNLTPDKRTLLLNNEKILLLAIKKSLINTFGNIPSTFKINNSINTKLTKNTNEDDDDNELAIPNSQNFMARLSQWKATGNTIGPLKPKPPHNISKRKQDDEIKARTSKLRKIQEYLTQPSKNKFIGYNSESDSDDEKKSTDHEMSFSFTKNEQQSRDFDKILRSDDQSNIIEDDTTIPESEIKSVSSADEKTVEHRINCKVVEPRKSDIFYETITSPISSSPAKISTINSQSSIIELDESDDEIKSVETTPDFTNNIQITIDEIKSLVLANEKLIENKPKLNRLKFKTEINPNKNNVAEEELEREITKNMFIQMEIIGQFNLGFIIVRLDQDLFIIDQHASDEKYNFEDLQKTVILQHQPLAIPESLQLTAVDEMILMDNLKIFEANGFKFKIDENAPATKKIKLLGKPFSKNWEFGKDDIADLIFMLQDAPEGTMCRPPRIRDMFASRACRKSVMIGKALSKNVMTNLIHHMGEIEHPWNCPHGRPTMRHLINLAMLDDKDD